MERFKNKNKNIIIIFIIINLIFISTSIGGTNCIIRNKYAYTQILYVGGTGPNNYTKIQDAIDNSSNGDTIYVFIGVYPEYLLITKEINIIGESRQQTIITGNYNNNIIRINADNVTIKCFTITKGQIGIYLIDSSNFTIIQNIIVDNWEGIGTLNSSYGLISSNILKSNDFVGINPVSSMQITISGNLIENSIEGIFLSSSTFNNIYGNTIRDHIYGLEAGQSSNNNKIYHNNLYDNDQNAKDDSTNTWDDDYPSGGNYWDDYNGNDNNGDGIGDTPYNIPGGSNKDRYPLMNPWNEPPYQPSDPNPEDGSTEIPTNAVISVYVSDPEGNTMDISFYNAVTQELIDTAYNAPSFTRTHVTWKNLSINTTYFWYTIADDGTYTNQSDTWKFTVGETTNNPPEAPTINGPLNGNVGIDYTYNFSTMDPDQDKVYYYINWGDGNIIEWIGPYNSSETITINHKWANKGKYIIRTKAKDLYDAESQESTLEVNIPRNKFNNKSIQRLLNNHSYLIKLIQLISFLI